MELRGRVLIIGGGISGLATAHFLLRDAQGLELRLVESTHHLGGHLRSDPVDGFVFERGPNGFLDNAPETLNLVRELGLEDALTPASSAARKRYLLKDRQLLPVPMGPMELMRSPLLSWKGRLRVLAEPFRPKAVPGEEDSVASFGRRRFGPEATATFLDAMATGIWAADIERLSLPSAFPKLAEMERRYGSLLRAMRRVGKERAAAATPGEKPPPGGMHARLCSFRDGIEDLVKALAKRLGERAAVDAPVESVRHADGGFEVAYRDGRTESADAVVVSVPAPRAANIFSSSHAGLARDLEAIPYAPVAVACVGYRREQVTHSLDGFGFLVPRNQGVRSLGMIWSSTVFPAHAPEGAVNLRAFFGGARDPEVVDWSAEKLLRFFREEMGPVVGLGGEPVVSRVYRHGMGIPQYNLGHARRLDRIEEKRRTLPGLFLTGNAFRGVGVNDCVRDAAAISAEVVLYLKQRATT